MNRDAGEDDFPPGGPLLRFLRFGGFVALSGRFGASGAVTTMRTISTALRAITARAAMASVAGFFAAFGFAGFVSGGFWATITAFFGPLLVPPGFGCGRRFYNGQRSAALDADFEFGHDIGMKA